jgi:hypothetical protein
MHLPPLRTSIHVAPAERSSFILPSATVLGTIIVWILAQKFGVGLIPFLEDNNKSSWLVIVTLILLLVFAVFSIGHAIDMLSNTILERFLSDKLDGFPHERIVPNGCSTQRNK